MASTTFDLHRLAFVSSTEKQNLGVHETLSSPLKAIAHFISRQLVNNPCKLNLAVIDKLCRAYHDIFYVSEDYNEVSKKKYIQEMAEFSPLERERRFLGVINKILTQEKKAHLLSASKPDAPYEVIEIVLKSLGIGFEIWDVQQNPGNKAKPTLQRLITVSSKDAPVLKILLSQYSSAPFTYDYIFHGFQQDWLENDKKLHEETLANIAAHNKHYKEEEERFNKIKNEGIEAYLSSEREKAKRKAKEDKDKETKGSKEKTSSSSSPHTGSKANPHHDSKANPGSKTNVDANDSPFKSLLSGLSEFFGKGSLEDEKGNLTLTGLFAVLITGVLQVLSVFGNFMKEGNKVYQEQNPGRPLAPEEIKTREDEIFSNYVEKLENKAQKERLYAKWREAKDKGAKNSCLEDLKGYLIDANNMEAYNALLLQEYLGYIRDQNFKNHFNSKKANVAEKWQLLAKQFIFEGSYVKAAEALQILNNNLDSSVLNEGADILRAYQNALNELDAELLKDPSLKTREEHFQHCQIRDGILEYFKAFERGCQICRKEIKEAGERKKKLEDDAAALHKKYEQDLAAISKSPGDVKTQSEKIENDYQSNKVANENEQRKAQEAIARAQERLKAIRANLIINLRDDKKAFIKFSQFRKHDPSMTFDFERRKRGSFGEPASKPGPKKKERKRRYSFG